MKCISIRQPWAHLIIHAGKDIENRTWSTKYRGPLLIHAAKTYDYYGEAYLRETPIFADLFSMKTRTMYYGHIIGTVDLIDCVTASDSRWFFGPYGFVLANPVAFDTPIPYRGRLGLFGVERREHDAITDGSLKTPSTPKIP